LRLAAAVALSVSSACVATAQPTTAPAAVDPELAALRDALSGAFSSAEQSKADPENYYDIRLHMTPIWPDRTDGPWLYVEQAVAARPRMPYRQRVYRLKKADDGKLISEVYELPGEPLRYAGAWQDPAKLKGLTPEQLSHKSGCDVGLTKAGDGTYAGGTTGNGCPSALHGAAYASSQVKVFADRLETWDRGYDKDGKQVWGAEKGGYVFKRQP
jgi:hypothetical protein